LDPEPAEANPGDTPLATTPLDALHREFGARMVPFAGYAMPVQYDPPAAFAARCRGGVLAEHLHCRTRVSSAAATPSPSSRT
jgi:aminomethyltransferase